MKRSLQKKFEEIVGSGRFSTQPADRLLHSQDRMTETFLAQKAGESLKKPDLILWPETVEEISKIVRLAQSEKIPLIPFGGGSGVLGGVLPIHGGVVVDMKRMTRVDPVRFHPSGPTPFSVTSQTGILGSELESRLNKEKFTLGHFPASISLATLGGFLATRSAGQFSSRYGNIENMVEAVEAVLPTGEILRLGEESPAFPKVDPKEFLIGSEGTLGFMTRAQLKLHPLPPAARYRGISFNHLESALEALREILQSGLKPSVVRLYDPTDSLLLQYGHGPEGKKSLLFSKIKQVFLETALHHADLSQSILKWLPADCLLILGFEGEADLILAQEKEALAIAQKKVARDEGEEPGLHWLKNRYGVASKMPKLLEQGFFVDTIEVAATWKHLFPLYQGMRETLKRHCLVLAHFSHGYPDGCSIYLTLVGHTGSARRNLNLYRQIWREAMERCLDLGGTISHHHGIGLLKSEWLPQELGIGIDLLKKLKRKLDPAGILNPGKLGLS